MTKAEFLRTWSQLRESYLRKVYKGQPHGEACLIMSLCDIAEDAEKLWRKHRRSLKHASTEEFFKSVNAGLERSRN